MVYAMDCMQQLPHDTWMFCGHEYSIKNLEFCAKAEPDNERTIEMLKYCSNERDNNRFVIPTRIEDEMKYNVFMRCRNEELQKAVGHSDPVKAMACLREWKNSGSKPAL